MGKRALTWKSPLQPLALTLSVMIPEPREGDRGIIYGWRPHSLLFSAMWPVERLCLSHLLQKQTMVFANRTSLSSHLDMLKSWLQLNWACPPSSISQLISLVLWKCYFINAGSERIWFQICLMTDFLLQKHMLLDFAEFLTESNWHQFMPYSFSKRDIFWHNDLICNLNL